MNSPFSEKLLDTGILQFGYFITGGKVAPMRFCPEYLPAHPVLLAETAKLAVNGLDHISVDRLLVPANSLPLGIACGQQSNLSLVYSRGMRELPVHDLVGSFNSGHTCALLMNSTEDKSAAEYLIRAAQHVGLEVKTIIALLKVRNDIDPIANIPIHFMFRLVDVVDDLLNMGRLPVGQGETTRAWACA